MLCLLSSHPASVTRIGINHLLLTGRFNAAGARFTDSVLEHGVEFHIRYLLLKSGFLRRKVVLQGGYPALQLVDINTLEALERFLRRVELRLVVVTGCPDFLNLADGLVVFAELLLKLGFLFLRHLYTELREDSREIFHSFSFLHDFYTALSAVESEPLYRRRGDLGIKKAGSISQLCFDYLIFGTRKHLVFSECRYYKHRIKKFLLEYLVLYSSFRLYLPVK